MAQAITNTDSTHIATYQLRQRVDQTIATVARRLATRKSLPVDDDDDFAGSLKNERDGLFPHMRDGVAKLCIHMGFTIASMDSTPGVRDGGVIAISAAVSTPHKPVVNASVILLG